MEHLIGLLAAGHTREQLQEDFPWLEPEDITACLLYARRAVGNERIEPVLSDSGG